MAALTHNTYLKLYTSGEMNDPSYGLTIPKKPKSSRPWKPKGPFRFLDLPSELRKTIYEFALLFPRTIDLDPSNRRTIARSLQILYSCKQVYQEAYHVFYGRHTFRIFPTHTGYLNTKEPVLMRVPPHFRNSVTFLELRLGPGWSKPPGCQSLSRATWLKDCQAARHLKIFVELDPSHDIFKGYRISDTFYTDFATEMVAGILRFVPSIELVEFDAWPSVKKHDALMTSLIETVQDAQKRIVWGPLRGWEDAEGDADEDGVDRELGRLQGSMALLAV